MKIFKIHNLIGSLILIFLLFIYLPGSQILAGSIHPWHDVEAGFEKPDIINVIIEIPKGSRNKYELDKASGLLKLDRVIDSPLHFPFNYGFIPQTFQADGDPLDALVLTEEPIYPMTIVKVRILGSIIITDNGQTDTKIVTVPVKDKHYSECSDISCLPKTVINEINSFFQLYKEPDSIKVAVERIEGVKVAVESIHKAIKFYNKKTRQ